MAESDRDELHFEVLFPRSISRIAAENSVRGLLRNVREFEVRIDSRAQSAFDASADPSARPSEPLEVDLQTARDIVKRCGIRDGLFKGPRTLNAVDAVAWAITSARFATTTPKLPERDAETVQAKPQE